MVSRATLFSIQYILQIKPTTGDPLPNPFLQHQSIKANESGKARNGHSHHSYSIVVEYSWDIFGGEFVGRVTDQKARFANGSVTNDNASEENKQGQWE